MQPDGPFRFVKTLGLCQVGRVWSAVDENGRSVTVAVLEPPAAADEGWRTAFAAKAEALAQPSADGPRYQQADFTATAPWAAYAAEDGPGAEQLFQALGMECQPAPLDPAAPAEATPVLPIAEPSTADSTTVPPVLTAKGTDEKTEQLGPVGSAESESPQPVSAPPQPPWAAEPLPITSEAVSGPSQLPWAAEPEPVSGPPHTPWMPQPAPSPQSVPQVPVSPAVGPVPENSASAQDPFPSPVRHNSPAEPPRRRSGLLIGIGVLVLLLLLTGAGIFSLTRSGAKTSPTGSSTPSMGTTDETPSTLPTMPPQSPGLEPPTAGTWPTQWPKFLATDRIRTFANLDGLGFTVKVPRDWECVPGPRAEDAVKYYCGVSPGANADIGGELIVRNCPDPCGEEQQTTLRQAEEAWGLQWIRSGEFSFYGETSSLQIDGERRYALIVVAYWRSGTEGHVDRQLVFRMTAPVDGANQLRRVANYIRDAVIF